MTPDKLSIRRDDAPDRIPAANDEPSWSTLLLLVAAIMLLFSCVPGFGL